MTKTSLTTAEKTALALDGDSLHGISVCLHPNNSSTCALPPAGHSQVGVRIQSILQTALHHIPVSCRREAWPSSFKEVLLQWVQREWHLPCPRGACTPSPPYYQSGQSPHLSSSHPSSAWYLKSGTTKDDCSNTEHGLEQMRGVTQSQCKNFSKADRGAGGQTASPDFSQACKGLILQIPQISPNPQNPKYTLNSWLSI